MFDTAPFRNNDRSYDPHSKRAKRHDPESRYSVFELASRGRSSNKGSRQQNMKRPELSLSGAHSNADLDAATATVLLLDEDARFRAHVERLLLPMGLSVRSFDSVDDFLSQCVHVQAACLVLEAKLRVVSGLDLQRHLALTGDPTPLVFATSLDSAAAAVQAMKAGAINYLVKPLCDEALLDAIFEAIELNALQRGHVVEAVDADDVMTAAKAEDSTDPSTGIHTLTPREREVVELIAAGKLNKQVAFELGISEMTVKVHRGRVMKKMGARTVVDLVRKFDRSVKASSV